MRMNHHPTSVTRHGLGIVDNNEQISYSYLNYCSHRREYRIWGRRKGESSRRQRELYTACVLGKGLVLCLLLSCKARAFFICLHGGVVSSINAVCPSWRRYSVKPSQSQHLVASLVCLGTGCWLSVLYLQSSRTGPLVGYWLFSIFQFSGLQCHGLGPVDTNEMIFLSKLV